MVTASASCQANGPGLRVPARLLLSLLAAGALYGPSLALAQPQPTRPAPATSARPAAIVPDPLTIAKLVWGTMAAIDHANDTGNYSVLRQLGSPGFQAANTPASLSAVFGIVRELRLELADTFLLEPLFEFPPRIEGGLLRLRGGFRLRPTGVQFDLLFQWNGAWQLHGVAVAPLNMAR